MICKGIMSVDFEEVRSSGEREIIWREGFRQGSNRTKYRCCQTALEVLRMSVDLAGR